MKNSILKVAFLAIAIAFVSIVTLNAQPPKKGEGCPMEKGRERLEQLKKIKLLEILDLKEEQADKFLVKYSAGEKTIADLREKMMKNSDDLREALAQKSSSDIKSKTEEHLKIMESMQNAILENNKAIRATLDDTQFAKYLLFEDQFMHKLQKAIMNRGGMKGMGKNKGMGMRQGDSPEGNLDMGIGDDDMPDSAPERQ